MVRLNLFKNGVQPAEVEEDDDDEDTQLEEAYERPPIPGSGAMAKFMEKRKEFEKALKAEEARVENEAMALEGTRQDPNGENKKGPKNEARRHRETDMWLLGNELDDSAALLRIARMHSRVLDGLRRREQVGHRFLAHRNESVVFASRY